MIFHFHSATAILAALGLLATGTAQAGIALTAEDAASLARRDNPELQAARGAIAAAQARSRSTGRLANPEIEAETAGGQDFEGRVALGLTQRFPLTARLRLERHLSALEIEKARLEVNEKELQVAFAARDAFYELAAAREAAVLADRQARLTKELARMLEAGASDGTTSALDAAHAALVGEEMDAGAEALHADEALAAGRLATLLGLPADAEFSVAEPLTIPGRLPANRTPGFRPDLRLAELAVQAGAADVSLARASRWEDVGVGVFVEGERFRDEPDGIEPEALVGVRFNIALPLWQDGSARIAEKQAASEQRRGQLAALRLAAVNEALAAYRAMAAHHRAAVRMETRVLPSAKKQAAATEASHQRGEIDIQALFRARERLAALEISAFEARKKFFLARSEWLAALGEPHTQP